MNNSLFDENSKFPFPAHFWTVVLSRAVFLVRMQSQDTLKLKYVSILYEMRGWHGAMRTLPEVWILIEVSLILLLIRKFPLRI